MKTLNNKVIAITGGASGIGLALSEQCLALGARIAVADINQQALRLVLPHQKSSHVLRTPLNVCDKDLVEQWAKQVINHFGQVDCVINNAGISLSCTIARMCHTQLQHVMNVNFYGVVNGVSAFLPHLLQRQDSHIVNISSIFGLIGVPTQSAYNASKFAVLGYTQALTQEMATINNNGLRVSCVLPGGVNTNIVRSGEHYDALDGQPTTTQTLSQQFSQTARTTPNEAAEAIIRGILKNKQRILIGSDAKFIALLQRLFPTYYERILLPLANLRLQRLTGINRSANR